MNIQLTITPHMLINGTKHPHLFDAYVDGEIICTSSAPFYCSARSLIAAGYANPGDVLIMRHAGATHDALRGKVGVAAGLTIREGNDRIRSFEFKRDARFSRPVDARIEQNYEASTPGAAAIENA